jgi:hypothetical protein
MTLCTIDQAELAAQKRKRETGDSWCFTAPTARIGACCTCALDNRASS